jgi:hypothetical protein
MAANTRILTLAILGLILYRLFTAFTDANTMPVLCEIVDQRYRATAYGLVNMMGAFAGGLGIYAGGVLRDQKFDPSIPFDLVALFVLLSAILFYLVRTQHPPPAGPAAAVGKRR